jgi:hypothetical protein
MPLPTLSLFHARATLSFVQRTRDPDLGPPLRPPSVGSCHHPPDATGLARPIPGLHRLPPMPRPTQPPPDRCRPLPQPSEDGLDPPCTTCRLLPVGSDQAHRTSPVIHRLLGQACRVPPVGLSPSMEVSPPPFDHRRGLTSMADLAIVSWVFLVLSQLRTYIVAMRPYFTVATDLIWPVTIVTMHHSSDGHP